VTSEGGADKFKEGLRSDLCPHVECAICSVPIPGLLGLDVGTHMGLRTRRRRVMRRRLRREPPFARFKASPQAGNRAVSQQGPGMDGHEQSARLRACFAGKAPARMCGYRSNRCSCRSGAAKAPSPHRTKGRWQSFKIKTHEFHAETLFRRRKFVWARSRP